MRKLKKKYYSLMLDAYPPKNFTFIEEFELNNFDSFSIITGKDIVDEVEFSKIKLFVDIKRPDFPDYLGNSLSFPIISRKLLDLIESDIKNDCQIIEAPLYFKESGKKINDYYVLNILSLIDCLDEKKSELLDFMNKKIVQELYVSPEKIPQNKNIFRVKYYTDDIVVSEKLFNKIIESKVVGIVFSNATG